MAVGPGKYDNVATAVRQVTQAQGVVLMILGGVQGSGFSVQLPAENEADSSRQLVAMLRGMADDIERETNERTEQPGPEGAGSGREDSRDPD